MPIDHGADGNPANRFSHLPLREVVSGSVSERAQGQLDDERRTMQATFDNPQGLAARQLLRRLFKHPAAYYSDPGLMQFFEGQRSVIEYIEEALERHG